MNPLYAYSLVPVLSVALLLLFTVLSRPSLGKGIAALAATIAAWTFSLLLTYIEPLAPIGQRFAACGSFVVAGYLHLAWDFTNQTRHVIVWLAYLAAAICTLAGAIFPGVLYDPISLSAGELFWPAMASAVASVSLPMVVMLRALRHAQPEEKKSLGAFLIAGAVLFAGAWGNALLLASGYALPFGLFLILGALFVIFSVISRSQTPEARKLLESSLLYSSITALIWAGFLFGVLAVVTGPAASLTAPYGAGALFLLCMAAIAFEPLRRALVDRLATRLLPGRARAEQLARALVIHEERSDQAERLAELGAFTSAIAHEVRNPLGVISAHVKLLERSGASPESVAAIKDQLARASRFVDELVHYGRPRALELRPISLHVFLPLAISTASQGRAARSQDISFQVHAPKSLPSIEGDQSQLLQVLVILLDNAILAMQDRDDAMIHVTAQALEERVEILVEDSGPGIPEVLAERLFEPFVTGRGRDHEVTGTGLGLAIAARIVTRHGGALTHGSSEALHGASFTLSLPITQSIPGATVDTHTPTGRESTS